MPAAVYIPGLQVICSSPCQPCNEAALSECAGALEGISYLQLLGLVGWSVYTKVKTGKGLPSGPSGLIGAAEGLSYLTVLVAMGVFGFELVTKGSLPGPTGR